MTDYENKLVMETLLEHDRVLARLFQHFLTMPAKPAVILKRARDAESERPLRQLLGGYQIQYAILSSMLTVIYAPDGAEQSVTALRKILDDGIADRNPLPEHPITAEYRAWCKEHPVPEAAPQQTNDTGNT